MRQVLHSAISAACAAGALLAGTGLVLAAGPSSAADAGGGVAAAAQTLSQDAGVTGALSAREFSKDAGPAEPAAMPQPSADAGAAAPAPAPPPPAKIEAAAAPAVEKGPALPARAKPPKKNLGLMLGGSGVALAGAAAMGIGLYYLHVDGRPVCRAGETAPCDFERDTRTFGDVMLASGSGVLLLGAAAFFWGFYSDTTAIAVTPTGMVVTRRF
jgi:hypothetical protein